MDKIVPEKLINFRAYHNGKDLLGITDIELPSIKYMTVTIKGAGIAGEIDSPTLGHYSSIETKLNWRAIVKPLFSLAATHGLHLDMRGAQQMYDPASAQYKVVPVKVVIEGTPKTAELGKFDVGAATGSSNTIETTYIKIEVDKKTVLEIDKYNFIATVNGEDYLADVREALGL